MNKTKKQINNNKKNKTKKNKTKKNKNMYKFKFNFKDIKKNRLCTINNDDVYDTIIIGAGASGLAAANHLQQHGKKIIVLEARDRLGGRIHDAVIKGFGKIPLGAAWLHHKGKYHILKKLLEPDITKRICIDEVIEEINIIKICLIQSMKEQGLINDDDEFTLTKSV